MGRKFENSTKTDWLILRRFCAFSVGVNDRSTTYFQNPVTGLLTTTNASGVPAGTQWFRLTAGVTKVRFYLWIEGQDVDCENAASGASISYNMQFSLLST